MLNHQQTTLLATLGGQPQVITFALDSLLAQGVPITSVVVLHFISSKPRQLKAIKTLEEALETREYRRQGIQLTLRPMVHRGYPLPDVQDEADANASWEIINQLIIDLKETQQTLHVCISGGRRILCLMVMSAAMLHFGHQDKLWHMYTPEVWQQKAKGGALMHLPMDSGFTLIEVPMMPWGSYFPALRTLTRPVTSGDVLAAPKAVMDYGEAARRTAVLGNLTRRQTDVLHAFAAGGDRDAVAARLHISVKTVDSHKTVILDECRNAWDLPEDTYLGYRFIAEKFGGEQRAF